MSYSDLAVLQFSFLLKRLLDSSSKHLQCSCTRAGCRMWWRYPPRRTSPAASRRTWPTSTSWDPPSWTWPQQALTTSTAALVCTARTARSWRLTSSQLFLRRRRRRSSNAAVGWSAHMLRGSICFTVCDFVHWLDEGLFDDVYCLVGLTIVGWGDEKSFICVRCCAIPFTDDLHLERFVCV